MLRETQASPGVFVATLSGLHMALFKTFPGKVSHFFYWYQNGMYFPRLNSSRQQKHDNHDGHHIFFGFCHLFRTPHLVSRHHTSSHRCIAPSYACISGLSSASSEDSNKVGSLVSPAEPNTCLLVLWRKESMDLVLYESSNKWPKEDLQSNLAIYGILWKPNKTREMDRSSGHENRGIRFGSNLQLEKWQSLSKGCKGRVTHAVGDVSPL